MHDFVLIQAIKAKLYFVSFFDVVAATESKTAAERMPSLYSVSGQLS